MCARKTVGEFNTLEGNLVTSAKMLNASPLGSDSFTSQHLPLKHSLAFNGRHVQALFIIEEIWKKLNIHQ